MTSAILSLYPLCQTHVLPSLSSGSNTASQPKCVGPLGGTICPHVLPSKRIGSCSEPSMGGGEYAKVQRAYARRVGKPSNRVFKPSCPSFVKKSLMYGPGKSLSASKQRAVSSVTQAVPSWGVGRGGVRRCQMAGLIDGVKAYMLRGSLAFRYSDFLSRSLHLWHCCAAGNEQKDTNTSPTRTHHRLLDS
jgi:hypothetical protein